MHADPNTIVVIGASGATGMALLERAVLQPTRVRAFVRPSSRLGRFESHPGVDVIRGDVRDRTALQGALAGADAVLSAIGPRGLKAQGIYTDATAALLEAMPATGCRRLIFVTSGGHEEDPGTPWFFRYLIKPLLLSDIYRNMAAAEALIEASALDWTIVRPSMFIGHQPFRTPRVRERFNPEGGWKISREHTAEFMLQVLREPGWIGRKPALAY